MRKCMITLYFFGILACFGRVWNISSINLVIIIINIRLCVSLIFYCKFGSILALIWVLVYLGGIIVCFVYILFITSTDGGISQRLIGSTKLNSLVVVILFVTVAWKAFLINSWNLYKLQLVNWNSSIILSSEIYFQIISQSPLFFFISAFILLYGLLQVLSMLKLKNKTRSYYLL